MRTLLLMGFLLTITQLIHAQERLFYEMPVSDALLSDEELLHLQKIDNNPFVLEKRLVKINALALNQSEFELIVGTNSSIAKNKVLNEISPSDFSWFGSLSDETGIFLTVMGKKVISKFYLDNVPYTLLPLSDDYHVLIAYNNKIDQRDCGVENLSGEELNDESSRKNPFKEEGNALTDDACRMRVLLVVTAQAEPEILIPLDMAARMLEDETNLAYLQSQINYRMEIARVVRTDYNETTSYQTSTEYGNRSSYPSDLLNLRSGFGLLSDIPVLRDNYAADVVVMIRSDLTNSAQQFYGIVLGVPTGTYNPAANNAFALISTEHMIGGRFTFAHEIGHIQGARHNNHNATPTYARGYVFNTANSNNRTIMAVGCADPATGCRVQFFSNPNVYFNGVPVGVANQYDNARRINETANDVLNFRVTLPSLDLPSETYDAEILARHVAATSISTNNNNVVALSQSRVSFRAANNITLLPGFEAQNGSEFSAVLSNCTPLEQPDYRIISHIFHPDSIENKNVDTKSVLSINTLVVSPNPFTNNLAIRYNLTAKNSKVSIEVYTVMGIKVVSLLQDQQTAGGTHIIEWNAGSLPSGIYLVVLTTDKGKLVKKVVKK